MASVRNHVESSGYFGRQRGVLRRREPDDGGNAVRPRHERSSVIAVQQIGVEAAARTVNAQYVGEYGSWSIRYGFPECAHKSAHKIILFALIVIFLSRTMSWMKIYSLAANPFHNS